MATVPDISGNNNRFPLDTHIATRLTPLSGTNGSAANWVHNQIIEWQTSSGPVTINVDIDKPVGHKNIIINRSGQVITLDPGNRTLQGPSIILDGDAGTVIWPSVDTHLFSAPYA